MKIFAFIMSVLVLGLSIVPCGDTNIKRNIKADFFQGLTNSDENDTDDCSPLCNCSCCAGFSINHATPSIPPISLFTIKPICNFLFPESIEVSFSFWQPPRNC